MRPVRLAARVSAVALTAVAVGVSVNQILNGGRWNWWALAVSLMLAALAEAVNLWLGRLDARAAVIRPVLWPTLIAPDGSPRRMSQVTPRDLGVHPNRFGPEGEALYIPRDVDGVLDETLAGDERPIVVVAGPRLAGTTSTLAQAAQTWLRDHLVVGFVDDPRIPLAEMIDHARPWARRDPGVVMWLDGLTPDRISELALLAPDHVPDRLRLLATIDTADLEGLRIPEHQVKAIEAHSVWVDMGVLSDTERAEICAQRVYAGLRPVLDEDADLLMGRLMVAREQVSEALTRTGTDATDRIALLHAVTDWYRARLPRLLTTDVLDYLYRIYRLDLAGRRDPAAPVSAVGHTRALEWATMRGPDRPRLIEVQTVAGGRRYAPHPLLAVIADDDHEQVHWPIQNALWAYADRFFDRDQRRDIGYTALRAGAHSAARRLLDHTDTTVDPDALHQIAEWLQRTGDAPAARHWYRRAAETGHADIAPRAMFDLGLLENEQGNVEEARRWYQRAAETGQSDTAPRAMFSLGVLESDQGNVGESRHWWHRAVDTGHPDVAPEVMVVLAILEKGCENREEARRWLRRAIATGHAYAAPNAKVQLGMLESEQVNVEQARRWYWLAVATGHPDAAPEAMFLLGELEVGQGNVEQARRWYRRAITSGHADRAPKAMFNLALLEMEHGEIEQARHWYRQAIATGHADAAPRAMDNLGRAERSLGDLDQARHWYRQAIATGHSDAVPQAMLGLGYLELVQRNLDQAHHWYRQAIATAHADAVPQAAFNLGILEYAQQHIDPARRWWERAVATGDADAAPSAMLGLGQLEAGRGNAEQARHWFRQAAASGHATAARLAAGLLREVDRRERDRDLAAWFSRYGWQAYADQALMRRDTNDGDR